MTKIILLLFVLLLPAKDYSYVNNKAENLRIHVLQLNHVGHEYKFNTVDRTITYLRFLGVVHTVKGKSYKILTSIWIWGRSDRATNRIYIYTDKNKYIGNYYLTTTDDIPNYITNNKLVFINKGQDCDVRSITYVDFSKGIPKEFFRKCKGDDGDIYGFSTE